MNSSRLVRWRSGDFTRSGRALPDRGVAVPRRGGSARETARRAGSRRPAAPPRPRTAGRCGWRRPRTWSARPGKRVSSTATVPSWSPSKRREERAQPARQRCRRSCRPAALPGQGAQPCCSRVALRPSVGAVQAQPRQAAAPRRCRTAASRGRPRARPAAAGRVASACQRDQAAEAVRDDVRRPPVRRRSTRRGTAASGPPTTLW